MPGAFRTPYDIANRALQILRRPAIFNFDDVSLEGRETRSAYDQLRLAELRRNLWRFSTRRVILRALTYTSQILTPPAYDATANYKAGDFVLSGNELWVAISDNIGVTPGDVPASGPFVWDGYYGPKIADVWSSTDYFVDELTYKTDGIGGYTLYRSLKNDNTFDPAGVDAWDSATRYSIGQVVSYAGINYQSLHSLNFGHQPNISGTQWTTTVTSPLVSNSWRAAGATLSDPNILYPIGVGPAHDTRSRNAFMLPSGYLRQAPTDPKIGLVPFLGGPTGNVPVDWVFESQFIVSHNPDPLMLRFQADIRSVTEFDPMFCVALASRMAVELAPRLADAEVLATIISDAREEYARTMSEARTVNGVEVGHTEPYEDEFIVARL